MNRELAMMLILMLALGVSLAAANPPQPIQQPQEKISCGAVEVRGYYTQGQPIDMRFMLQNNSDEPAVVDLGFDREGTLQFKVRRDGEGEWISLRQKKEREGISRVAKLTLQSQESYWQQIILDDWYKFEPGKYVVSFAIPKVARCAQLNPEFVVLPMDADWLSDRCSELVDEIGESKNDAAKAMDAANILARFENRLAVPFLIKALDANPMVDSILIPAIERIGDKEAIHFLISFLEKNVSSSARYELVRPALVRLEKRSSPEEVEKIRIALARFPAP